MKDTILQSFLRGRLLSAATGTAITALGTGSAMMATDAMQSADSLLIAILGLVTTLAAIASKLREIWRGPDFHD